MVIRGSSRKYMMQISDFQVFSPSIPKGLGIDLPYQHCGRVVRALVTGADGPRFKTQLVHGIFQKLSAHQ